jgi:ParB family chromosome partitioning protein
MLLNLNEEAKAALEEGEITLSQAEALSLGSFEQQCKLLQHAINNWIDAEGIRDRLLGDLPTLSMAIFDKEQYSGEYTSDLLAEDDTTYFNDVEQFMELQKAAAESLVEEYSKTAGWSELLEGYFSPWQYGRPSKGETGGVIVALLPSGEVEIHEGLIKTKADTGTIETLCSRAKDTYPAPLRKYMAMHKSIAVQAALLDNPPALLLTATRETPAWLFLLLKKAQQ